jgi:hypothetical protein
MSEASQWAVTVHVPARSGHDTVPPDEELAFGELLDPSVESHAAKAAKTHRTRIDRTTCVILPKSELRSGRSRTTGSGAAWFVVTDQISVSADRTAELSGFAAKASSVGCADMARFASGC